MKKISLISLLIVLLAIPSIAYAQKGSGSNNNNQGNGDQMRIQDPTTHEGDEVVPQGNQMGQGNQNQMQVNTSNQGESNQLDVGTQNYGENNTTGQKGSLNRSSNARQNMSIVAQKVEELLGVEDRFGGIGKQISAVAREQKSAQGDLDELLTNVENRKGWKNRLFGYDRKVVSEMEGLVQRNQLRIQQLQELKSQVQNTGDQQQLQETIQSMINQNTSLQEQIQQEKDVNGIFGWLIGLFN